MIYSTKLLIFLLTALILAGCAKRNDPVSPQPAELILLSETQTPGIALDLCVVGDSLFVADDRFGATIWDISDPRNPVLLDTFKTFSGVKHLAYAELNRILFLVKTEIIHGYQFKPDTIQMVFSPYEVGVNEIQIYELSLDTIIVGITDATEGYRIYKTYPDDDSLSGGFWVYSSEHVRNIHGAHRGFYMDIEDSYSYLANGQLGFQIARTEVVGNFNLTLTGSIDTYGEARDVALNGAKTHAVVADYVGGIQIFDVITDKSNPIWVGELIIERVSDVEEVAAVGDTVYFTDKYDGLFAADISNPEAPVLIAEYYVPAPTGIHVLEDHTIILTDRDKGILVFNWLNSN